MFGLFGDLPEFFRRKIRETGGFFRQLVFEAAVVEATLADSANDAETILALLSDQDPVRVFLEIKVHDLYINLKNIFVKLNNFC